MPSVASTDRSKAQCQLASVVPTDANNGRIASASYRLAQTLSQLIHKLVAISPGNFNQLNTPTLLDLGYESASSSRDGDEERRRTVKKRLHPLHEQRTEALHLANFVDYKQVHFLVSKS
jgi:hypothetical protein